MPQKLNKMKAVILAGGKGTRISEESHLRPKPMINIGSKPILWHILKIYSHYGVNEFIICLGYMGYLVKEYFANYFLHMSDVTFDMTKNEMVVHQKMAEPWKITLVDTGDEVMTGGRLKRVKEHLSETPFFFTYGDGVANIDLNNLFDFHLAHGKKATVTAIQPPGRYGALDINKQNVMGFQEKPNGDGGWINGGFYVLEPSVLDLIEGDETSWELGPVSSLAASGDLMAYLHNGYWQCMDTMRDKILLENLWNTGRAPWKIWA